MGLLPVVAMLVVGRELPRSYWLVAIGLFVSWFADSATHYLGGSWWAWYFFLPLQLWFVLLAFIEEPVHRIGCGIALLILGAYSISVSAPGPEVILTFVGSVAVLYFARGTLALPVYLYFGVGSVAYLLMAASEPAEILPYWMAYQAVRLLSILFFLGIILPPVIRRKRGRQ